MSSFSIGTRMVGDHHSPLVIPEVGINHGGSLEVAKQMVDAARRAGAEIIKHQTHLVQDEMSDDAKDVVPGNATQSIYEIVDQSRLSVDEERGLRDYVAEAGMMYMSTPFSRRAVDFLVELDVPAFKIGSGECNNYELVDHIAQAGKPVILSTGMNSIGSVTPAVEILRERRVPFALLHCTNLYPTPHRLVRLGAMLELLDVFPDAVIGLSDHTVNNNACLGAVALGASIVERHFTDTKSRIGPDIVCSMDEDELGQLIEGADQLFQCRGGKKEPAPEEAVTMAFAFSTAVALTAIKAGETLTKQNVQLRRPATGDISPADYQNILGRPAVRDIGAGRHIMWEDVS